MSSSSSSTSTKLTPFQLPGFTLPLNFTPHEAYDADECIDGQWKKVHLPSQGEGIGLFKTALNEHDITQGYASLPLTTLREFTMLHIMNHLTDKPHWESKVFDDHLAQKWKAEALAVEGGDIVQSMVDWIVEELRYKAKIFQETRAVSVYNGDVVKSDVAVPGSLKERLVAAVARLENVPEKHKDFHPGSGGKVLDLVHPSLFPLVYGRSRILPHSLIGLDDCIERCGGGTRLPVPPENEATLGRKHRGFIYFGGGRREPLYPYSQKFQWLPCNVAFINPDEGMKLEYKSQRSSDGTDWSRLQCKITSYINNLHPQKHQDLYMIIADIITRAIPLWNMTLAPLKAPDYRFRRIEYTDVEYDSDPETIPEEEQPQQELAESDDDFEERRQQWFNTRRLVRPEPGAFQPPNVPEHMQAEYFEEGTKTLKVEKTVDLQRDFGKRGLQVIVKLANIHLTPEKPKYEGGTWHIEGQMNEHICATALYYYSSSNITTSRLSFRHQCSDEATININYEQDDHGWLSELFGCENHEPGIQKIGDVICTEGRLLTFPNILQHRVAPFRLADPSKEGHRKILALFLVDPHLRIISTANVPPQQRDWWSEHLVATGSLPTLPAELQNQVFSEIEDFPIGLEEAKELRLELMEERKRYRVFQGKNFGANEFSLCEH